MDLLHIRDLTLNNFKRFYTSVFWSALSDLVAFCGIFIVLLFVDVILQPFFGGYEASLGELLGICALGLVYMVIYFFAQIPAYKANYESTYKFSAQGRLELAEHLRKLPLGFLQSRNAASLSHSIMNDFARLEGVNSHMLPQTCASLVVVCIVFVGLCVWHWQMALAFFACVPLALAILLLVRYIADGLSTSHMRSVVCASNVINEYIDGISTIRANLMGGAKFARLESVFDTLRRESIRIEVSLMPFALSILSCMGAGIGIMVMVGRGFLLDGELSVIEYIAFLLLGSKAFVPLMTFCVNFIELQYFAKSGQNILSLLQAPVISGQDKDIPTSNDIRLEHVSFGYKAKQIVLHDISLHIKEKSSVAIVGDSGSGKSTLVKLIARFYEPSCGKIYIGKKGESKDISTLDYESFIAKFSMVFQDVYLFGGSVESNLKFAKENASKEAIEEVLKKANALEFVQEMPNGINTNMSEGGKSLSGGQKQRLSIARCLLKDAPIVLLDEMTSSLDVKNEYALQKAINALSKDKTIIIIAHKLRSITHCDCIIYLEKTPKGSIIAESGTHKELLAKGGKYAQAFANEASSIHI